MIFNRITLHDLKKKVVSFPFEDNATVKKKKKNKCLACSSESFAIFCDDVC